MQANLHWCTQDSVAHVLDVVSQSIRRSESFSEQDRAELERHELPFTGDREDGPPLAWVVIWGGTYSNMYGDMVPDSLQEWGYVFWDAGRLVESGGEQELRREWAEVWKGNDPRDNPPW